ncbi:hypothetical protein [Sphingomonas sp.]|jgi:hypothetical protein
MATGTTPRPWLFVTSAEANVLIDINSEALAGTPPIRARSSTP